MFFRIILISLGLLLTGCRSFKSVMGFDHEGPNEFDVTPLAPLSLPEDFHKTPKTESEVCVEEVANNKKGKDEHKYEEKVELAENKDVSQILFEDCIQKDDRKKLNIACKKNSDKKANPSEGTKSQSCHTYKFLDLISTKTIMKPNEVPVLEQHPFSSEKVVADEKQDPRVIFIKEPEFPDLTESKDSQAAVKPLSKPSVLSVKKRIRGGKPLRKKRPVKKARRNIVRKPRKNCKKIVCVRKKRALIKKKTQILFGKGNY